METTTRLCGAGYKVMTATMLVNDNSPNEIVGIGVLCIRTAMMRVTSQCGIRKTPHKCLGAIWNQA